MKKIILITLLLFVNSNLFTQCFNIETILVDACGDPEGENEMVILNIYSDVDINDLVFDWPNNSFLSWCADGTLTTQLNNTIASSCGILIEPPLGIVPANSKLLVVTSTNMLITANSFVNLSDTLYIIYQCAGNTSGHFSNSATTNRYLTVDYTGTCSQSETVSYLGTSLVGGDGAAVFYDGITTTYFNTDCNAPVPNANPNWEFPSEICSNHEILDLNDFLNPNSTSGTWSGDIENIHFFNPLGKLGFYSITFTVDDPSSCLLSSDSTIVFEIIEPEYEYDTIVACDSILYKDTWFKNDTTIDIVLNSPGNYNCDLIILRTYIINKANFQLNEYSVVLESGESHDFEIIGDDPFIFSFTNNENDNCDFPCATTTINPTNDNNYIISVENELNKCVVDLKLDVSINYNSIINIPDIFTPNNDGENDYFKIYTIDIAEIKYQIYSKWGELIFDAHSITDYWNGEFNGYAIENGVYLLNVEAIGKDGKNYKETKNIVLKR